MLLATLAALAAAALFALATALLHRSAGSVRSAASGAARFVVQNARQPLWAAGMVAELAGFGFHALAVHSGPLTLVQPLLVSGVVFALPLRQVIEGRRPAGRELLWAAALAVGLTVFLLAATPGPGRANPPDRLPTALCVVVVAVGLAALGGTGIRSGGVRAAGLLGAAAGLAFAAVAALLKVTTAEVARGPVVLFSDWPVYGLVLVGVTGLVLDQLAFRAAPLRFSLPALSTVDPIASLIIGVAVFDEPFRATPAAVIGEIVGLGLVVVTVLALTRSEAGTPLGAGGPAGIPPRQLADEPSADGPEGGR